MIFEPRYSCLRSNKDELAMNAEYPLIRELDALFHQDPDIDELGIIFTVPRTGPDPADTDIEIGSLQEKDSSPEPQFILQDHKLGVSLHSVHPLINEARRAFPGARAEYLRARRESLRGELLEQKGLGGVEEVETAARRLLSVTKALLLVNADHGSAWNARKELVRDGVGGGIRQEIKLLDLIFTKHAKSPNAWAHRRWCWKTSELFGRGEAGTSPLLSVEDELKVCQRVADLYPKNYYAWTQRSWVVLRVVGGAIATDTGDRALAMAQAEELLQREVLFVDKWLRSHVSDHSALNHRKNVASALAAVFSASDHAGLGFVKKERSSNSELIRNYPGHASLWCYRRFVCQAFLVIAPLETLIATPRKGGGEGNDVAEAVRSSELKTAEGDSVGAKASANVGYDPRAAGDGYDWSGWNRAATEWYNRCVREDAEAQRSSEDEDEDEDQDDTLVFGETAGNCGSNHGDTREALPGTPSHGGMLAEFLGQEALFALRCAADKGAWQYHQQRRHALAHIAFITYAASRVVGSRQVPAVRDHGVGAEGVELFSADDVVGGSGGLSMAVSQSHDGKRGVAAECMAYCEVTGAPKLIFPLEKVAGSRGGLLPERPRGSGPNEGETETGRATTRERNSSVGGTAVEDALGALKRLNDFVTGLAKEDAVGDVGGMCGGSVGPYRLET